jgi:tryptophan-rich sensory protein
MNWPPMLLHLKFPTEDGFNGLWLPFFLVYPILLVVSLIVLPFLLIAVVVFLAMDDRRAVAPLLALPYIWNVIFKMRGLLVDIKNNNGRNILIDFI